MAKTIAIVAFLMVASCAAQTRSPAFAPTRPQPPPLPPLPPQGDFATRCREPDGLFPTDLCDEYLECRDGVGTLQTCPNGLVFDDRSTKLRWACLYPSEIDCGGRRYYPEFRSSVCRHDYGLFLSDSSGCGSFVNCVAGHPFEMKCPEGLAFNEAIGVCDWPDEVPTCDVEAYLGFKCPGEDGKRFQDVAAGYPDHFAPRYGHATNCARFFTCVNDTFIRGIHDCGAGLVYNPKTGTCDDPENVPGCEDFYPPEVLAKARESNEKWRNAYEDNSHNIY